MREMIHDGVGRILADKCTPSVVRAIESGASCEDLWRQIDETGFIDALSPEAAGGAGLSLTDVLPIPDLCGRYAVPVPLTETMILRAAMAMCGQRAPKGSLTLATGRITADGSIVCASVPMGKVADHVVIEIDGQARLLPAVSAEVGPAPFILDAAMIWPASVKTSALAFTLGESVKLIQAFTYAAQLGGAFAKVFQLTLDYANQREQFGRPIGKFQAIQHQLALMAEQVFSARMAIELSATTHGVAFDVNRVALAKARTSEAAVTVAALAHGIHGAIGFTEEFDLHLLTRRINTWRLASGSESYWFAKLGAALAADSRPQSLDFLRDLSAV
jgi:acyl-CoA dehydrogenase